MTPAGREVRVLARLALPVAGAQVGMMLMGLVDTWMVGRLGPGALGAVGLADVVIFCSFVVGMGLVMGIDPLVSQAHGAGEGARAGLALQRGLVVGALVSLPVMAVWWFAGDLLLLARQRPATAALGGDYARIQVWSVAPLLFFNAMRQYLLGRGMMLPPLVIVLLCNLANVFFNWVLIFGHLGFPAMGVRGAGLATGLTRLCMAGGLAWLILARRLHKGAWMPWSARAFAWRGIRQVLRFGLPTSLNLALEVWAFSATTLFAGRLPMPTVASHIIVLKCASMAFMMPLGISIAAATRVGNLIGAGDGPGAKRSAWVAIGLGCAIMSISAVLFVVFRRPLADVFTDDEAAITLAATIFPIAAAFQLFDGTQVVGVGILRGMGTPRPAAVINLVGYWILALPLAYWLGIRSDWGLAGIWWALAAGLAVVAVAIVGWIRVRGPDTVTAVALAD